MSAGTDKAAGFANPLEPAAQALALDLAVGDGEVGGDGDGDGDECLVADGQVARVLACSTHVEAVRSVLDMAGVRTFTGFIRTSAIAAAPVEATMIVAALSPTGMGSALSTAKAQQDWHPRPDRDDSPSGADQTRARLDGVARTVRALAAPKQYQRVLARPYNPNSQVERVARGLAVSAWWATRLAEGHTPATARLLLALTAHPALLGALTFPDDQPHLPPSPSARPVP